MNDKVEEQRDRRVFDRAHVQAAGDTARAQNTASHHQAEFHKYKVSQQSSDPNVRREGKTIYCNYLRELHSGLIQAYQSHGNAIIRGDYYVGRWDNRPEYRQHWARIKNTTSELKQAQKGIDSHAKAIEKERRAYKCR